MIRVTSAVDEDARPAKRARTAKDSNNESDLAISTSKSTSSIAKRSLDRHGSLYNEVRDLALTKSKSESKFNARNSEYHNGFDLQSLGWATLPHIILERIFLFLKERHRVKAMFVCKRWYTVMRNSASLWRIKSFRFSGRDPRDSTNIPYRKATQFVRTFGKYLRSLEFRLYNPANSAICRKFQKAIRVCFISLIKDKTKLRQLAIPGLQFDRGQWTASEEDFAAWLSKYFCKGQHTLEKVNLRGAKMSLNDGYKVLFSLGYDMAESMRYLDIEDFFHSRRPIYVFTEFVDCLRQFRYLQELYINYSYVSEDLLETMADNLAPNALKRLHIKVHIHDAHDQIILGQSWQALREKCPDCRVDMIFNRVLSSEEHFRILCPQIPLRQVRLYYLRCINDNSNMFIIILPTGLFQFLKKSNRTFLGVFFPLHRNLQPHHELLRLCNCSFIM